MSKAPKSTRNYDSDGSKMALMSKEERKAIHKKEKAAAKKAEKAKEE